MPINFPSLSNLVDRTRSDIRGELPNSDPTIFGSFFRALAEGLSNRSYDIVLLVRQALDQSFIQTSSDIYLDRHGERYNLFKNVATNSIGDVVFTGVAGTSIPNATLLNSENGLKYTTQRGISVTNKTVSIASLTRSGTTVTATTSSSHSLASGLSVVVSGANEIEYNGTFEVTVIGLDTFQYEVSGSPATPATGTISFSIDSAVVSVQSNETGKIQNLDGGSLLTLNTPITNIDSTGYANFSGVGGGSDIETEDDFRDRILFASANPVSNFNSSAIKRIVDGVSGVTRSFVQNITPNVGDVTVYFFRDNDTNPIPSSSQLAVVKNAILEILPATSDESNVYVLAPEIINIDFTFTSISPDTPTMRSAIENNLLAFFQDKAQFETNVTQDQYRSAIIETQDTETGQFLQSFVLSAPTGDITINSGQIGGLGVVTFS